MSGKPALKRRTFLQGAAAAAVAPVIIPGAARGADGAVAANSRIGMGLIGCGNQGIGELGNWLGDNRVQLVAVCDPNKESDGYWSNKPGGRDVAQRQIEQHYGKGQPSGKYKGCASYEDYRDLLDDPDVDAVYIGTPDHWHAQIAVDAARAGKDVYGQKPLSLTIPDGRAMVEAVERYGVVWQTGSQQRSDYNFRRAAELVLNGRIGKLHTVRCGLPSGTPDYNGQGKRNTPEPVPKNFNYDLWLGPAPWAPYCFARCHVNFRWILDYSGGQLTDWGGHHPDCAQWGMGTDRTGPVEIVNAKGTFSDNPLWNTATAYYFECIYKNGVKLIVSNRERGGVTWEGTEGKVWANRGSHDAEPKSILKSLIGPNEINLYRSNHHWRNFIDCVISRGECAAPVEVAHRSISIAHLGNIAMRTRSDIKWDPDKEEIVGNPAASALLRRAYREPWGL